ncbi:hypothetical protein AQUCO_00500294v1 [Aquilegia coerulea]|uniref:F-box domain-containing protein n=1 Tax=Aquilegia coerulea TaxID=218851 RepID=A0A2G5ER89_AQUCA|nr:hypothetical protein AQUCO_00500294v1 [Aquilegia coerulea]
MAKLLKKVFESVKIRCNNNNNSCSSNLNETNRWFMKSDSCLELEELGLGLGGEFDRIPVDLFIQILKLLGPKESARISIVCKSWRIIVSDNRLWIYFLQNQNQLQQPWDSIVFAEKHLRSGYPLFQSIYNQSIQLSFMHIYGQRAQLNGSVIIDGGSGYCKFGWSKYASPSGRSATFLEFGNIESPMYSRLRHFFATIYNRMQVKPSKYPIVLSVPICHYDDTESAKAARRQLKETIYSVLFDMNVPAVCALNQATLALFAARRVSGIVVNIGFHVTSIVPILRGKVMREVGVEVLGQGAVKLTGYLRELMQQKNMNFGSLYTVRTLKENLCYVATDYEAELQKDTQASFTVPGEGLFTLSKERFQTGEILFQPRMGGVLTMGLHRAVGLCMHHCQASEVTCDDGWFKTVVLAGGTACLPGLPERLEKELRAYLPTSMSEGIRVIPPQYGAESAWFGGKMISNPRHFATQYTQFFLQLANGLVAQW